MKPNTKVKILAFVGPTFADDWSETVIIRKPNEDESDGGGWYIVETADYGRMTCHKSRLRPIE